MERDQSTADRERIAGEMTGERLWTAEEFHELGNAIRAFEVLCEPREWQWFSRLWLDAGHTKRIWWAIRSGGNESIRVDATGNHAADVCRLVCEVLDREAKEKP